MLLTVPQLLSQNRRGQSQSALRAVQGRHEAIQKIERQMIELAQLFQDMEAAVVQQEAPIEHIDNKAEDTVVHLDKGNEQLNQAVDKARSARRKKWICLGIVGKSSLKPLIIEGHWALTFASPTHHYHRGYRCCCGVGYQKVISLRRTALVFCEHITWHTGYSLYCLLPGRRALLFLFRSHF